MTKKDKNIDDQIRSALDPVNETLDELVHRTEPGILAMTTSVMRGRQWMINLLAILYSLAILALGVFAAVQFFHAEAVRDLILWATIFVVCLMIVSIVKVWFWMAMNRNAVTREVKRVELQVTALKDAVRERASEPGGR